MLFFDSLGVRGWKMLFFIYPSPSNFVFRLWWGLPVRHPAIVGEKSEQDLQLELEQL